MKRFLILCAMLAAACGVAFAQTTVYNYTSNTYVDWESIDTGEDTPAEDAISFAPFDNTMRLRGSITVSQPLPPNLEEVLIGPGTDYPITWSFNSGLDTYNNSNQEIIEAGLSTDAEGNITQFLFFAVSPKRPFEDGQSIDLLMLTYGFDELYEPNQNIEGQIIKNLLCITENDGACNSPTTDELTAAAILPASGVWSRSTPSLAPVPVPGLGGLGLLALGSLMAGVVARRSHPTQKSPAAH